VGHNAIVHGCEIHDNVLIGMGAIVMDNAVVPSGTIVAAGAVVLENQILEPNCIYAGTPAKKVKELDPDASVKLLKEVAAKYVMYTGWHSAK
jgi:carbonic anhydrase/acetyltransferase-like protein (isoleucine patch superfamily)